jgi:16S rRNA G527 N7-methylase RsmG
MTLLESRRMKALFLIKALTELGIERSRVWCQRIERIAALPRPETERQETLVGLPMVSDIEGPELRPEFDLVTARAVSRLPQLTRWVAPVVRPGGRLLAYKGSRVDEELADWRVDPGPWEEVKIERDVRPHTHLIHLRKQGP